MISIGNFGRMFMVLMASLLLAGCGTRDGRSTAPQATVTAPSAQQITEQATAAEPVTPSPAATPTTVVLRGAAAAIATSTVAPAPQTTKPFFLGVPAGDAYDPAGMAVDTTGNRAYVYARDSEAGGSVIAVVDLARGEVLRLISLRSTGHPSDGQVLLSPDSRQGYVVDTDEAVLPLFDPDTGALGFTVVGVTKALLSPDGERLYATMGREGLRTFATADLTAGGSAPAWSVTDAPYIELAVNSGLLAAPPRVAEPALVTFDGATGRQMASTPLEDVTADLAPGPDGGWLLASGYDPMRLVRLDAGLRAVAEAEAPSGADPYYDGPRGRYLVAGWEPDGRRVVTSYAEDDLVPTVMLRGVQADMPDVFAPYGDDRLLGLQRHDGALLSTLDPTDLSSTRDAILGVKLAGMALNEVGQRLYVADDQDRIHVLGLPGGEVSAVWDGAAPIALDTANRRLYVNRAGAVVALHASTGRELARFPQGGIPAPDPSRDLVYITDAGVMIYDHAGMQVGRLDDTFLADPGVYPIPFSVSARVNPTDGTLVTIMNNGTPGSNNRTYLRLYPLQARSPITITGPFTFVSDLVFDPGGDLLVSYGNALNMEALQRLDSAGHERSRLSGRTGKLALDPKTRLLYVASSGALARVDAAALQLRDLYRGPSAVSQVLLHPVLRQLYMRNADSSRITVFNADDLEPIAMRPVAVDGLQPDADVGALDFLTAGEQATLYSTTRGEHYGARVTPGSNGSDLRWEQLSGGSMPSWGGLTVAGDVLFRAGAGEYGGDGVFRSRDGGMSWDLLAAGLTDLRPAQPVLARSADEAYFVGRTGGIFAWRPGAGGAQGKWERIVPTARDYESPGELSLAPDGTLFLASWNRVRRSTDGGRSWSDLPLPGDGVKIAGFDPDYAHTRILFSFLCSSDRCQVVRSSAGGETQQAVLALPPYSSPLQLRARAGRPELYLYTSGYMAPQLYRSLNGGESWQTADPSAVQDTTAMAIAPDGRLWFGARGSVRVMDPATLLWSAAPSAPTPTVPPPTVAPRLRSSRVPTATLCAQHLPDFGCPITPEKPVTMARQPFQRGRMVWIGSGSGLADWEKVVVVLTGADDAGGTWQRFPDTWLEGQPESDPALVPQAGLYQPIRGFGRVWREQLDGPQSTVGWATAPEEGLAGSIQSYQGGLVLRLGDAQLRLGEDGSWRTAR